MLLAESIKSFTSYFTPILSSFNVFLKNLTLFLKSIESFVKIYNFIRTFGREWFFTTNHKKLGLNYLLFASISGLFGTLLATLIRLELSQPNSLIFANKANAYHVVVGMHAIIMVFFLVTPIVFGGFGNYFLPIQVGARDVAYPRLNNFSLWILPAGLITAMRTLWEGMKISNKSTYYEQNVNNYSDWLKLNEVDNLVLIYNNDIRFDTYNYNLESQGWFNLIDHNASNTDIYYINCNIVSINESSLLNFLPTLVVSSDLTNTMAGWTFTTPFSHSRFTGNPVDWAFAALLMSTISSVLTLINLVITWRYLRGRGSRYQKELFPIVLISIFISLRLLIIVSPILNAGLFMLMADRHFNTAFFTVRAGGDILLFQHIFWFFGHPEVYILIMPAFGIVSTLIPYYVRKPVGSKLHMIYAMHAISSMGFVVWGHHMYLVGIDNKARILFFIITVMIALPASVKVCGWVASLINSTTFISTELLFSILFIGFFVIGGITGSFCAHTGTDIMLHDTYYIVGHFHIMLSGSLMAMLFAYIYFNFREFFNTLYNKIFSIFHLIFHGVGQLTTFLPMLWLGYAGMPRRIQDYPWGYAGWHSVASFGHTIVLLGIFSFLLVNLLAFYLKRPVLSNNNGLPFISSRVCALILNINYSKQTESRFELFMDEFLLYYMNLGSEHQLA